MSTVFDTLAVAACGRIVPTGLYFYEADGTVISSDVRGPGSVRLICVALDAYSQRVYAVSENFNALYIFDETLSLIATVDGGDIGRSGYELDSVCVPSHGKVWAFASYNDTNGASIYEYDRNGDNARVVVANGPGASVGRMRNIWSAVTLGRILYYVSNSNEAANVPPGPIFTPYNFFDVDGAIHRFDCVTLTDLSDLQPMGTAPYTALSRMGPTLLANIGHHSPFAGNDTVERYVREALVASFSGGAFTTGLAIAADRTSFVQLAASPGDAIGRYKVSDGSSDGAPFSVTSFDLACLATPTDPVDLIDGPCSKHTHAGIVS